MVGVGRRRDCPGGDCDRGNKAVLTGIYRIDRILIKGEDYAGIGGL